MVSCAVCFVCFVYGPNDIRNDGLLDLLRICASWSYTTQPYVLDVPPNQGVAQTEETGFKQSVLCSVNLHENDCLKPLCSGFAESNSNGDHANVWGVPSFRCVYCHEPLFWPKTCNTETWLAARYISVCRSVCLCFDYVCMLSDHRLWGGRAGFNCQ